MKSNVMRSQRAVHESHSEKVSEMNTDERLGKVEAKVEHLQSDVTELKTDVRELKSDVRDLREAMHAQGKQLLELIHAQGKELREAINAQGKEFREAINAQGTSLRAEIHALALSIERFKWRFWGALTVLFVLQLLVAGGAPAAIVRALKLP